MNKCMFYGLISTDLNLKINKNENGEEYSNLYFSLGVKDGKSYSYIPCITYSNVAKLITEYLSKDEYVIVDGQLKIYESLENKELKSNFIIQVNKVYFTNNKKSEKGFGDNYIVEEEDSDYIILKKNFKEVDKVV